MTALWRFAPAGYELRERRAQAGFAGAMTPADLTPEDRAFLEKRVGTLPAGCTAGVRWRDIWCGIRHYETTHPDSQLRTRTR